MRIGLFADIHANREAIEACLRHAQLHGVDQYAFIGDLIGYGADPEWALDTVRQHHEKGAIVIVGNHDDAVVSVPDKAMHEDARRVIEWTRSRINASQIDFLAGLPLRAEKNQSLYVHANPWQPGSWEYITDSVSAKRSFAASFCRFTFCGHLHEPGLYHQGITGKVESFNPVAGVDIPLGIFRRWLAVLGAVGQPRDGNPAASYAIHDSERNMLTYFRVPFDTEKAAEKIRRAGLPDWLGARLVEGV